MAILTAETEYGTVEGMYSADFRFTEFRGIPYSKAPVGERRWKAPEKPDLWEGVRKARQYSGTPVQLKRQKGSFYQRHFYPVELPQNEDCLYLNIITPAQDPKEKLPVAVWIYGGGYNSGFANKLEFNGEPFAARGCVYVSFNYRVGLLGFMAHPELSKEDPMGISGNYGLQDQIMALKWVKKNIAAFGGDPDNITIFGQSAGAFSCMNLACTPQTDGIFKRVICESGGGLHLQLYRITPTLREAEQKGVDTLADLGISSIEEARKIPAEELIGMLAERHGYRAMEYQPNVDGKILPESSVDAILAGHQKKVDYLIGSTSDEGYAFNLEEYEPASFRKEAEEMYLNKADDFLKAVGYKENGSEYPTDTFGDWMFAACTAWNRLELQRGRKTAYQYYFTKKVPGEECGAFHSAEHAYIFHTLDRFDFRYNGSDYDLAQIMTDYWTNFMKTGDPNGDGLPEWKRFSASDCPIMELGAHVGMIPIPDRPGAAFAADFMLQQAEK